MASSVTIGPAFPMDGPTYNRADLSPIITGLLLAQAIQVMSGVLPAGGALAVAAGSGMHVTVASGQVVIASSSGVTNAGYLGGVLTSTTLDIAGADPVNPRIDLVCATVNDLGSSASNWELQVITGTPAGSPGTPATPANSLALATVLVPANALSITGGDITDERVFTVTQGGIVPVPNLSGGIAALSAYGGLYAHDRNTGRLVRVANGPAAVQPVVLPFTPVRADRTASTSATFPTPVTLMTTTFTTDGTIDVEIEVRWPSLTCSQSWTAANAPWWAVLSLVLDGTPIYSHDAIAPANPVGGSFTHVTQSGTDRPGAGNHTLSVVMASQATAAATFCNCSASSPAMLYVRPAPL